MKKKRKKVVEPSTWYESLLPYTQALPHEDDDDDATTLDTTIVNVVI